MGLYPGQSGPGSWALPPPGPRLLAVSWGPGLGPGSGFCPPGSPPTPSERAWSGSGDLKGNPGDLPPQGTAAQTWGTMKTCTWLLWPLR